MKRDRLAEFRARCAGCASSVHIVALLEQTSNVFRSLAAGEGAATKRDTILAMDLQPHKG